MLRSLEIDSCSCEWKKTSNERCRNFATQGIFRFGEQDGDVFADPGAYLHPDVRTSLFGPSGEKEAMIGRDAFVDFARRCGEDRSDRSDEIVAITGIDEECALVHARAWRQEQDVRGRAAL